MRYHIDTIPVWDAFRAESECPLCDLRAKNEQDYLDAFLGASVMEPDVRMEVNAKGFCARHFSQMFDRKNRLGLALMTHTHLKESLSSLCAPAPQQTGLFGRRTAPAPAASTARGETCVLCERLDNTMNRYLYTVLHLWKTDEEFAQRLESSKGVCLPHYHRLTAMAAEALDPRRADQFLQMLERVERSNLDRLAQELEWFTLKFDYRNADKPWGTSRDAPERAINKLRGRCVGDTPPRDA